MPFSEFGNQLNTNSESSKFTIFRISTIQTHPMYSDDKSVTFGGNKLCLNVTKCEYMFLGNSKQLGKISEIGDLKVGEDEIKRVRKTNYLGLNIDECLSWNQQYKMVKGKLN